MSSRVTPGMIRAYMYRTGDIQSTLAKKVGVHQVTISKWLLGRKKPSVEKQLKLLALFKKEGLSRD